jgi:predicted nucleic acid-binding protein
MSRVLLDTDAVIDYLQGIPDSIALIRQLREAGDSLCTCDVVIAEVLAGLLPKDRVQGITFLEACEFLPTTFAMACQAGAWRYQYARSGVTLATTDTLIAAIAHGHQARIVTGNLDDYPMPEITTIALPRPGRRR